jgi:hypothetical protein
MKNHLMYCLSLMAFVSFFACSNDDSKTEEPVLDPAIAIKLASDFAVDQYNVIEIKPEVTIENAAGKVATYVWSVKVTGSDGIITDSIIGDSKNLMFISPETANYVLDFTVTVDEIVKKGSTKVSVSETGKTYNSKALSLIDFVPGPAYTIDSYDFSTKAEVMEKVQSDLENGEDISLGTFGGYITTAFDHTVVNVYGKRDFTVQMNSSSSSAKYSPASILVAYDANKNGKADDNEWYEIAGSEYYKSTTVKNYEMTYFKPDANKPAVKGTMSWEFDKEYIKWTNNKNASGNITKVDKRKFSDYYPNWMGDSYTVKGTKITLPVKDVSDGQGTTFNVGTFEWGYGGIKDPSIDISWAVDKDGKKVHLPGIDFVKVYVPTFVEMGANCLLFASFQEVSDLNFEN